METKYKFNNSLYKSDNYHSNYYNNNSDSDSVFINYMENENSRKNNNIYMGKYRFYSNSNNYRQPDNNTSNLKDSSKIQPNNVKKFNVFLVDNENEESPKSNVIRKPRVRFSFDEDTKPKSNNSLHISNNKKLKKSNNPIQNRKSINLISSSSSNSSNNEYFEEKVKKPLVNNNENSKHQKRLSLISSSSSMSTSSNEDSVIKYNYSSKHSQNYHINNENKPEYNWNEYNLLYKNGSLMNIPPKDYRISLEDSVSFIENMNPNSNIQTVNEMIKNNKNNQVISKNENQSNNHYFYDTISNGYESSESSESSLSESSESLSSSVNSKSNQNSMKSFSTESGSLMRLEKSLNYKFPRFSRFNELKLKYGIDAKSDATENESYTSNSVEENLMNPFNSSDFHYNQYGYLYPNMFYYTENQVPSDVSSNKLHSIVFPFTNHSKDSSKDNNGNNNQEIVKSNNSFPNDDCFNTKLYKKPQDKVENQLSVIPNNYYNSKDYYYDSSYDSSESGQEDNIYPYQTKELALPYNKMKDIYDEKEVRNRNKSKNKKHTTSKVDNKIKKSKLKNNKNSKYDKSKEHKNTGSTLPLSSNKEDNSDKSNVIKNNEDHAELIKIAKLENENELSTSLSSSSSNSYSYYDTSSNQVIKEKQTNPHEKSKSKPDTSSGHSKNKVSNKNIINRKNGYCISNNNEFFINTDNEKSKNKKSIDRKLLKHIKRYINENNIGNSDIVFIIVNDKVLNDDITFSSSSSSSGESSYVESKSPVKKIKYQHGSDDVNNKVKNDQKPSLNSINLEENNKLPSTNHSIETSNTENQSIHPEINNKIESMSVKENESKPSFIVNSVTIPSFMEIPVENSKVTLIPDERSNNRELTSSIIIEESDGEELSSSESNESIEIIPREVSDIPDEPSKLVNIMVDKEIQVSSDELDAMEVENQGDNSVLSMKSNNSSNSNISFKDDNTKSILPDLEKEKLPLLSLKDTDGSDIISIHSSTEIIIDEDNDYLSDEIISESDSINISKSTISDYEDELPKEDQKNSIVKEPQSHDSTEATKVNSSMDINFNNKSGFLNKLNSIKEIITESPPETVIEDYQVSTSLPQKLPSKESVATLVNKPFFIDNANVISSDNITINNTMIYNESLLPDSVNPAITSEITLNNAIENENLNPVDTAKTLITPPPSPLHIEKNTEIGNQVIESSPLVREPDAISTPKVINRMEPLTPDASGSDKRETNSRPVQYRSRSPYMDDIKINPTPRINIFPYIHKRSSSGMEISNKRRIDISQFISSIRNREESLKAKENEFLKVIDQETEKNKEQKDMIQKTSNELNNKIKEVRQLTSEVSNHKKILMKQKEENDHLQEELEEEKKQAQNLQQQLDSQYELNSKQEKEISYYKEIHNMYLEENQRLQALLLKLTNAKSMVTSPSIPSLNLPPPTSPTSSINSPPKNPILSLASSANTLI